MMASRTMVAVVYAVIALAVCPAIFSAPAAKQSCAPVCSGRRSSVLKYEDGKTYFYNFETEVVTQLVGSTDESNRIKVKGQAALAAQSACDFVLTVQQIAITSTSGQAISRVSDIEGSSIRFAYTDGVVDSVCVSEDDPTWSANIKRAIVSMLANRALNGDTETIEADVNGNCKTKYQIDGNKYTKTKDLLGCTSRDGGTANVYGVPYTASSKYHSIPLFKSVLTCVQELGKGIVQNVECNEGHSLDVIESSGVRTDIKSTLSLANIQSGITKGRESNKRSCLLYDFADSNDAQRQKASASNAVDILNKMCKEIEAGTVSLKVPGLFLQLRKAVGHARKDDLKLMHQQITEGKLCSGAVQQLGKLYLDAAGMSAGDGPISFLAEVIANGQVEDSTKDLFLAYAIFAPQPGASALQGIEPLVSRGDADTEFLLTASGLAHQYCRMTNSQCGSNDQYRSLVDKIAQHVKVATDEESIERVIVALQALGNLDNLTPSAVTALVSLIEDSSTIQRLKVRALDAFRRDPCQDTLKKKALKIFSDIKESSQVRIQAYLTVSKCLKPEDVPAVQAVIDNDEESNQVGSFVVSHVYNILESSAPGKLAVKKVFQLIKLRDFPNDIRKFSRNFEISAYEPTYMNSGISVDSNLIFSQDSYIPRCTNANFTVDAFGRSYNLMELGMCAEDFESIIERIIGPTSELRAITLDDIIRESADKLTKLKSSISNRFKRDVAVSVDQNEIDAIRNEVNIAERTGDNANGDIYGRVLGTTIIAESFSRDGLKHHPVATRILRALERLSKGVQDQKVDITEPFLFMDDETIVPTSSGLPLTVQTEGTSVLSLQIQGNLDVASLIRGNNGDMRAKIMPSAATVIKAKMVLGHGPIESGLQIEGKIHSAAGVDLKVVREGGKFELRVNIPQERIQVFDIRSDVYWVEQSMDQLEKKTPMKTKVTTRSIIDNQCSSSLTKAVGLKVCADIKIPQSTPSAPLFFLNGPSVVSLFIEKIEPSMEGYYVKIESIKEQDTYGLDFVVDTPGSRTNRKVSAQARAIGPASTTPQYSLKIESPSNNVEVNYKRSFTDDLKGMELKVAIDGETYNGLAELRKTADGAGYKLVPVVQYQLPQGNPVKILEGEITRIPGQQLSVNIKTGGPFRTLRGSVKGSLIINRNEANNVDIEYKDLEFASEEAGKVLLSGLYKQKDRLIDFKLDSKYGKSAQHTLTIDATGGARSANEKLLKVVARSSRRDLLNFDLDWSLKKEDSEIKHHLHYTRGLTEPKVLIHQESEFKFVSRKDFDIESELTIKHPGYNIDFHAEAEVESVPDQKREAKLELKAANGLKAKASYEATAVGRSWNYNLNGKLELGDKTYEISEDASTVDDNTKKYKSRLSVQPGFYYEADTIAHFKMEQGELKSDLSTVVTSDQLENPIKLKSSVTAKREGYEALLQLDAKGKTYLDLQTKHQISRTGSTPSYTTNLKAHIYDIVDAKLANTYSGGNGDLVLDATLIKSGRKIAATSKLLRSGDAYDLKADLKWDAERDPTQAITFKSITTLAYSELRLNSMNDITVIGKSAKVNLRGSLGRDILNGENTAEIDYVSPSGKSYSLASKLDLENQANTKAGKLNLKVARPDVQPSELEAGIRASNINQQDRTFDIKADIKANYRGEKDITIHGEASSAKPGNYRSYSGSLSADGSALPRPIAVTLKTDVKSGRVAVKAESKKGLQGAVEGSVDVAVDYDYSSPKRTLGVKYAITTPVERVQSVDGELKTAYSFTSLRNFELSHENSIALNGGSPYGSSALLSVLENEAKYNYKLISEGQTFLNMAAEGKLDPKHLRGSLKTEVRGEKSKFDLDVEHEFPNIAVSLTGEQTHVPLIKSFELKLSNKKNSEGIHDSEILARTDGADLFRLSNQLEFSPTRKSIDLSIAAKDEPVRKLALLFDEAEPNKWNVDILARWGLGGKYVKTKGSLNKQSGAFDGELSLDSPHFEANKFIVKVSKKLTDGRHGLDISIDGNNKRQLSVGLDFLARDASDYERSLDGSIKIEGKLGAAAVDFNGKFKLDDTTLDRQRDNGEEGRRIRADVEIQLDNSPMNIKLLAKRSNKEKRVQLSLCKDSDSECREGNIQLKHSHGENGNLDYEFRVTSDEKSGSTKATNGIIFLTKLDGQTRQFEHVAKLIINEEKAQQIGYRLYRTPSDREIGAELLLPTRIIAAVATTERPSKGGYRAEFAFYIDKTKNADRKVSLLFIASEPTKTADNANGRQVEVLLKHPDFARDIKLQTRYAYLGDVIVVELETTLDVLQEGSDIVAAYSVRSAGAGAYNTVLSLVSKGLHINVGSKGEVRYADRQLSYKNDLTYENRERQIKTSQVILDVSQQRFNFEITGPSAKFLSFVSAYQSLPTGGEIRYEIFLPGMEDTRIIRTIAHTVSPRNVQLKSFTSASPNDQYYEAFLGFKSDDELSAGVYDVEPEGRLVLADLNMALNGTRILSVKSDWNRENVRSVLAKAQARGEKHGERLRDLLSVAVEEIVKEVRHIGKKINDASPDFKVAVTSAKDQLAALKLELQQNEDTKFLLDQVTVFDRYIRVFVRRIVAIADTIKRVVIAYVSELRESLANLPAKYSQILEKIPEYIESLKTLVNRGADALTKWYRVSTKALLDAVEQLFASLPPFANIWNWIVDHAEGPMQSLFEILRQTSEKLANIYSSLKSVLERILKNRTVQTLLSELSDRLQGLLGEFIQDTKEQAETIKNYILSAVPQKEFQEFVEALADYIQKKASKVAIDDAAALRNVFDKLKATVKRALSDVFTVDPEKGFFRARIPLPVSLSSLMEFSKVFCLPSAPKITFRVPAYTYGLRELINQIRSGAAVKELVPPFKGYGLVIGSKHFKTFDGRFFEFEGTCQYVLASDFEDGNFTAVIDYEKVGDTYEKSIIVTDGQDTVAFKPDHSIVVNGQTVVVDTPKTAGGFLIERVKDWTLVRGKKGAIVGCSVTEDVCAMRVDGFYHGKVLGLLGKMNLERYDDLSKPNGEITYSIEEFVSSWKLNKQCSEPRVFSIMLHSTASAQDKCKTALDSRSSSLRPCYGVVDPTPFRNVCEKMSQKPGYTEQKAVCTAALGYAKACHFAHASVDAAPACGA